MDVEGAGDQEQVADFRVTGAALDALDGGPVDAGELGELLLGEVAPHAGGADAVAEGSTGNEDPFGLVGGHPSNALALVILSQQHFCGIPGS